MAVIDKCVEVVIIHSKEKYSKSVVIRQHFFAYNVIMPEILRV